MVVSRAVWAELAVGHGLPRNDNNPLEPRKGKGLWILAMLDAVIFLFRMARG